MFELAEASSSTQATYELGYSGHLSRILEQRGNLGEVGKDGWVGDAGSVDDEVQDSTALNGGMD